jgi:hypothetical protein
MIQKKELKREERKMPLIVATYVYACSPRAAHALRLDQFFTTSNINSNTEVYTSDNGKLVEIKQGYLTFKLILEENLYKVVLKMDQTQEQNIQSYARRNITQPLHIKVC